MAAPKGYIKVGFDLGEAYVKESKLEDISRVDAVIFDCDGVLIDIRESYDKAISKATTWIFEALTGCRIPEELISSKLIFLFRKSGGFSNDYDIVYGLLMFLLSGMPISFLNELAGVIRALRHEGGVSKKIRAVMDGKRAWSINFDANNLAAKIEKFTSMLDDTGVSSVDKSVLSSTNFPEEVYITIKDFLHGSKRVDEGIITTIFEEIFCGPELFERMYNIKPEIFHETGTIENSKVIVRSETLNKLSSLTGGGKFGVASGSRLASAKYVLGNTLEIFNPRALVFLDDVEEIEREYLSRGFLKVNLSKPNPYSLLRSAWALEPFRVALYIGDSIGDALTVNRANRLDPRFVFAGVYEYTGVKDKALKEFLKFGCDIISPSVNEIPYIIEAARRAGLEGGRIL
ncbi:MAG: hypothetical protein QXX99_06720 [Candidatus Bathyarchaeia archaeon]